MRLSLAAPRSIERIDEHVHLINTGSPHLIVVVDDPGSVDLIAEAHKYRYNERFSREGVNVNFVRWRNGRVEMRTYERSPHS